MTLSDGRSVRVADGESLLDAALRQGINLPHSCRGGSCMACKATVTDGRVVYPNGLPPGLTEDEAARGEALLCQAQPVGNVTVEAREILCEANVRVRRMPCRVVRMERFNHDVMGLWLKLPAVEPFEFHAGQYLDILLARGRRRSFSIANPPGDADLIELHVRHVPGGTFTNTVFTTMKEKALLRVEGPLGGFFLREDSERPILMMAGGTGFAPIKGMLRHMELARIARPVHFYWGARHPEDLYENAWVASKAARYPRVFRYTPVISEPDDADWSGRTGWVHEALLADYPDLSPFDVYMSGPPAMIAAAQQRFVTAGLPESRLYFDSFDYAADSRAAMAAEGTAT